MIRNAEMMAAGKLAQEGRIILCVRCAPLRVGVGAESARYPERGVRVPQRSRRSRTLFHASSHPPTHPPSALVSWAAWPRSRWTTSTPSARRR
jgi:hypothetical protein